MIKRDIEKEITKRLGSGKIIIVYGARQVGKTTALKNIFEGRSGVLWLNADIKRVRDIFSDITPETFKPMIGKNNIVIIDEAQRIKDIGISLKILHDAFGKKVQFVATGSSSFDLANKINEPLTGRKWGLKMYPLKISELIAEHGLPAEKNNFENRLLYGFYPDIATRLSGAGELLLELAEDNLYKDIYRLNEIRKPDKFEDMVKALAYQIDSEVNLTELGSLVSLDKNTVNKYINLLEQSFVIFRLPSYSRNLRNEIKSLDKFYFYDTGIRNAVINDFSPVGSRQDIGHLFENFIVSEFVKKRKRTGEKGYFWRNTQGAEVDYLSISGKTIKAYEIKWNEKARGKIPKSFVDEYNPTVSKIVNRKNFYEEIG